MLSLKDALLEAFEGNPETGAKGEIVVDNHRGNPVTVPIGVEGHDDETPLPASFIGAEFGDSRPADIGDNVVHNTTTVDVIIQTIDSDKMSGVFLMNQIHQKIKDKVRELSTSLGESEHVYVHHHRDFPARRRGGVRFYTRVLNIRGWNFTD